MEEVVVQMTRTRALIAAFAASLVVLSSGAAPLCASAAEAGTPSVVTEVSEIVANSREMDGSQVRLVGEAVGDAMVRGDHAWVNILDASGMAIGVYLPKDEALKVRYLGMYSRKGDTVDLTGTFHNSCVVHDGEPDIHADSLTVVAQGHLVHHPLDSGRAALGGAFLVLAGLMGFAVRRRTSRPTR